MVVFWLGAVFCASLVISQYQILIDNAGGIELHVIGVIIGIRLRFRIPAYAALAPCIDIQAVARAAAKLADTAYGDGAGDVAVLVNFADDQQHRVKVAAQCVRVGFATLAIAGVAAILDAAELAFCDRLLQRGERLRRGAVGRGTRVGLSLERRVELGKGIVEVIHLDEI